MYCSALCVSFCAQIIACIELIWEGQLDVRNSEKKELFLQFFTIDMDFHFTRQDALPSSKTWWKYSPDDVLMTRSISLL